MSRSLTPFYNDAENLLKIDNCKTGSVFGANFRHETTLWSKIVARARSQSHYMNKSRGESFAWNRIWIFWLALDQLSPLKISEILFEVSFLCFLRQNKQKQKRVKIFFAKNTHSIVGISNLQCLDLDLNDQTMGNKGFKNKWKLK